MKRKRKGNLISSVMTPVLIFIFTGSAFAWMGDGPLHQLSLRSGGVTLFAETAQKFEKGEPQKMCPISSDKIDKSNYIDYQGKRVYFCCSACKSEFLKDPKKYIDGMESKGTVFEKSPDKDRPAGEKGS